MPQDCSVSGAMEPSRLKALLCSTIHIVSTYELFLQLFQPH
jgi:hypothetical protein